MIKQEQIDALHGARLVCFDITNGYLIVWKGTDAIDAYRGDNYQQVAHWNIDLPINMPLEETTRIVERNIKDHVGENNYPF